MCCLILINVIILLISYNFYFFYKELAPFNIKVTVNCPPDTDTPGFAIENQTKPEETHLLSETAGLFSPSAVAR